MTNPTTKIYLGFIETLADRAKRSPDIAFRDRIRTDMLRYISRILNLTSIYLCQHNFEKKYSVVRGAFALNTYVPNESENDINGIYAEGDNPEWSIWLHSGHHTPRILYAEDLTEDHPEYDEYNAFDMLSVIFAGVYYEGDLWGYVEGWDTRHRRNFPPQECSLLQQVCGLIGETLITLEG